MLSHVLNFTHQVCAFVKTLVCVTLSSDIALAWLAASILLELR